MHPAKTLVPYHREFNPTRQILFEVIVRILKRLEPILRRHINHTLEIERHIFEIPQFPVQLSWTRIVHISDMHFHEQWEPDKMIEALIEKLRVVKAEAGDNSVVCVMSGDIVSKHTNFSAVRPHIVRFMRWFRDIFWHEAQLYACEGNHDLHRKHWPEERQILQSLGIVYTEYTAPVGIDIVTTPDFTVDPVWAQDILQSSLRKPPRDTAFRLILSHNLEVLQHSDIPENEIPHIIMGGHTHNGHLWLISDASFSDESDPLRRLMAYALLGYRFPLVAGVKKIANNIFASVSPGVWENENRPRYNSPRGLPVFELRRKK